ncbi:MAG: hypothetical protein K6G61_07125 [Solobacterium sp.]|nr:hypothetical protein [Solobacterium sp.]
MIVPYIRYANTDSTYLLTESLLHVFNAEGNACAVCAPSANQFKKAAVYDTGYYKSVFSLFQLETRSYEDWMYANGLFNERDLKRDADAVCEACDDFRPDRIITVNRPAGNIAARHKGIPCWTVTDSAMYRTPGFREKDLKGLNAVLYAYKQEQVFNLKELYEKCDKRITFGPETTDMYPPDADVTRIGMPFIEPLELQRTNRLCIVLPSADRSASFLKKVISDTFLGAPYAVHCWYRGAPSVIERNMHYHTGISPSMIAGSIAVIHDGTSWLMHYCTALGIPQVIIASHDCMRNMHALSMARSKCALFLYEEELSVSSLYETYRKLMSDDIYYENIQRLKEEIHAWKDLSEILLL